MKKRMIIRLSSGLLVVSFLFTSTISRSFDPFGLQKLSKSFSIENSSNVPLKSDSNLFDEEGEEKSDRDSNVKEFGHHYFLEGFIDLPYLNAAATHSRIIRDLAAERPIAEGAPLYLVNRSLKV
jgi:hypothetical protein